MSKTLVVSYLPNAYSVTKKVLDHFLASIAGKTTVIHRDLVKQLPPVFDGASMTAYQLRGFMGQTLTPEQAKAIAPFDELIAEIKSVDNVVFAFPTHNWSEPGVVKTYIDAILQASQLIMYDAQGKASGVLTKHKAFVLFASGGVYEEGNTRRTIHNAFTFYLNAIGITDITFAAIGGTLMGEVATTKSVEENNKIADKVADKWFGANKASA